MILCVGRPSVQLNGFRPTVVGPVPTAAPAIAADTGTAATPAVAALANTIATTDSNR
jgi:hypothetical protein